MKKDVNIAHEEYKNWKKELIDTNSPLPDVTKAKLKYPFTKVLLKAITLFSGEKISWLKGQNIKLPKDKTVIFANTHRFKPDFEKITIKTKRASFVVASDFKNSYNTISGWYFNTRPTIFVDPYSKEDKFYSFEMMKKYLKEGLDCTIFPEAVWNLSENKIILDTFFGSVKAALETDSLIVCTAIERYGKKYVINRAEPIDFTNVVKKYTDIQFSDLDPTDSNQQEIINTIIRECNIVMRDTMATLLYEIWEKEAQENGLTQRKTLPDNYWESFVDNLTSEWPGYKMSDNVEQQFQNKKDKEQREVETDIEKIKHNLNDNNSFMVASDERFLNYMNVLNNLNSIEENIDSVANSNKDYDETSNSKSK